MRCLSVFITIFILLLLAQVAVGQQVDCAEFTATGTGKCYVALETQITFGKGWTVTLTGSNLGAKIPGNIQFSWNLYPTTAASQAGVVSLGAYYTNDLIGEGVAVSNGVWLAPDKSTKTTLAPVAGCNSRGQECSNTPDPTILSEGVIKIGYVGSPDALRGLKSVEVTMENEAGVVTTVTLRQKLATISAISPASPASPASSVQLSWVSAVSGSNVVWIYRNGTRIWAQTPKGTETDWSVPAGTHRYCVRAANPDWTETDDLACTTVVVVP